jgi:hypothetical protein
MDESTKIGAVIDRREGVNVEANHITVKRALKSP